jgi:hypothetical protein
MMKDRDDRNSVATTTAHPAGSVDLFSSSSLSKAGAVEILTSPGAMADFFRSRLPWLFRDGMVLRDCRPKVLRDRLGSRQVVSYRLIFSNGSDGDAEHVKLVVKRYADKAEGRKTYHIMKTLWENGFNRQSKQRISEPFSYLDDVGLLIFAKAQGMLLRRSLRQGGPASLFRMRAVARWLMKLHHLHADFPGLSDHSDEETSIREFVDQVGSREHRLLPELETLASRIVTGLASFGKVPLAPVHGDFQCENIFVDKDRVTVVDFDRFSRSDPARDLGYLISQMRAMTFWVASKHELVYPGLRAFWEEYLSAVPFEEREALSARTSLFAARRCLQNIYYTAFVLPGTGLEIVSLLLREAERFSRAEGVERVLAVPFSS